MKLQTFLRGCRCVDVKMMDDKVQLCLTDGSEDVSDVVADVTLRSDRLDPDLSNSTQWIPINDCL